ncbi:MAG: hypothetical protein HKN21_09285 [Candidatus Eisenbacteria bacterium]|uniref:Uncharacterized protein n=1 Tax=Eiseniibacteriota bacterium TaxID=2212470 RepID=A0A7Y2E993_UNCEI|nr:hypothetical protein [Candidatus Eisenbacteria bacterium]
MILVLLVGAPQLAEAQLEENLSSFTDETAQGYLKPLAEAFGQSLNTGFFTSASIPVEGFRVRLEVQAMSVFFGDDDDTFMGMTGGEFSPAQEVEANTVVGPTNAVIVEGDGGTEYLFPGGFDLSSFTLAVPQLTIGSYMGTEATVRWIAVDTGDAEFGDIDLLGLGLRHNVSQYFDDLPVELAGSVFYQTLKVGDDDLIDATALSFGIQASKNYGVLEPFGSVNLDSFSMTSQYTTNAGAADEESIKVDFDNELDLHLLLGVGAHLGLLHVHVAGHISDRVGISGGLAFGL